MVSPLQGQIPTKKVLLNSKTCFFVFPTLKIGGEGPYSPPKADPVYLYPGGYTAYHMPITHTHSLCNREGGGGQLEPGGRGELGGEHGRDTANPTPNDKRGGGAGTRKL